jgi:hypothetical protein
MRERNGKAHEANGHTATASPNGKALLPAATVADGSNGAAPAPTEGRGPGGKFAAGNRHGRGNPHARRMASLRQAFLSAATEERLRELGERLLAAALAGDWVAAKLYLSFVIGKPVAVVDPDRLDVDEWQLLNANPNRAEVLLSILDLIRADGAVQVLAEMMNFEDFKAFHKRLFDHEFGDDEDVTGRRGREVSDAREDRRARARKR